MTNVKVTVTAELPDGRTFTDHTEVDSAGNPVFWEQGVGIAANTAGIGVRKQVAAYYGIASYAGVHTVKE